MAEFFPERAPAQRKVYLQRRNTDELSENDYKRLFRFSRESVEFLTKRFLGEDEETRGGAVQPIQRMEVTLRYLANPGFQSGVANEFGIHQTTVSKTSWQVVEKICSDASSWIKWPTDTHIAIQDAKQEWFEKFNYPAVIGAIDCTHVRIEKPSGMIGNEYINRKGFASINVQATCDTNFKFTSIDASWPGSVHDNRILKNSRIFADLVNRQGLVLLGDEGYGIAPFLMKPFGDPNTPTEKNFNRCHSRARVVIEDTFGQLKRRFPILKYMIRVQLERVPTYILACCVLHNIAKELNDRATEDELVEDDAGVPEIVEQGDNNATADQRRAAGVRRRLEIAQILMQYAANQ